MQHLSVLSRACAVFPFSGKCTTVPLLMIINDHTPLTGKANTSQTTYGEPGKKTQGVFKSSILFNQKKRVLDT